LTDNTVHNTFQLTNKRQRRSQRIIILRASWFFVCIGVVGGISNAFPALGRV